MPATFPPLRAVPRPTVAIRPVAGLRKDEAALLDEMLAAFANNLLNARRLTAKRVQLVLTRVHEFIQFAEMPPWRCTGETFEAWCRELVEKRHVRVSTERTYQGAIKVFYDYVSTNVRFRNLVRTDFGDELEQICNSDNLIPHSPHADEPSTFMFRGDELRALFQSLDNRINELLDPRWPPRPRVLYPLARDRAMFFLMLSGDLRAMEAIGLDTTSFESSPTLPMLGRYAQARVIGKGPKLRVVPLDNPQLPAVLERYERDVRPYFLRHADPEERAFFLCEHGRRISFQGVWKRLKEAVVIAGLDRDRFATHSLRRSGITADQTMYGDLMVVSRKAGHSQLSTTQKYVRYSDDFAAEVLKDAFELRTKMLAEVTPTKEK